MYQRDEGRVIDFCVYSINVIDVLMYFLWIETKTKDG